MFFVRRSPVRASALKWGLKCVVRLVSNCPTPAGYAAELFAADGTLLGSTGLTGWTQLIPGWLEADFASPIPIASNTTYVAAYYCAFGGYSWNAYGLSQGVTNGPLTAPASAVVGGNGVYSWGNAFPSSSEGDGINGPDSNFYVDVLFTPAQSTAYLTLSFNPANPSIASDAPLGSVVATIDATWSDGSPFTGSLSFAPPYSNDQGVFAISGNNLIIVESPGGISPPGAPRTVHDPLESHGSRCSAVAMT